jgi:hypothetical protein
MKRKQQFLKSLQAVVLAGGTLAGLLAVETQATAQQFNDLRTPETPLVLKAKGSFFVGGEKSEQTSVELGSFGPTDQITINQMYVEYMIPNVAAKVPVVMIHGATLSGKT